MLRLIPPNPQELGIVAHIWSPGARDLGLTGRPNLPGIGKFQVGERPCLKNQKWVEPEDHSSRLNSGLGIHAYI